VSFVGNVLAGIPHIIVVADRTGGNADDIGDTCAFSDSIVTDAELRLVPALGVTGGTPEAFATLPMNHD
jgi:hypothetical protein